MSDVAGFDAETRSRVDLRKSGSYRYAEDPSTKILCFSYAFGDERPTSWRPGMKDPKPFLDHIERGGEISGWNIGGFDIPVWNEVCVRKYDWPAIRFEQAIDTMAQAAAMHLPQALGDCVREVGLPQDKQKDKRGKYLIQRLCVPKIRRKGGLPIEEYFIDDPKLLSELYDYCDQDVVAERALAKLLRPLTPSEREFWIITQHINARGVPVDVNEIRNILKVVEAEKARLNAQAIEIAGGAFGKMSQLEEVKRWIRSRGVPVGSMDKEAVPVLLEDKSLPKDVRQVVEIHAAINQISIAKYETMLNMVCRDGTIKGGHVYHGASTGRDASRGLNTQNIVRPARSVKKKIAVAHEILGTGDWDKANLYFGHDLMDAAVACVRGVIKAPDGYRFIDVDYSSIENRVGAWVSGHKRKVQMFAEGLDEYRTFASGTMFHIPYEEVTDDQRQFCKPIILGCFGADTRVLAKRGWVRIVDVREGDRLWDGIEWVTHGGVIDQGLKPVMKLAGVKVTPDHLILEGDKWVRADSIDLQSAINTACGMSSGMLSENGPRAPGSNEKRTRLSSAGAATFRLSRSIISAAGEARNAISAAIWSVIAANLTQKTSRQCQRTAIAPAGLIEDSLRSDVVTTPATPTTGITAAGAYSSTRSGGAIQRFFSGTSERLKAGIIRLLKWTGLTTTPDTPPGTFDAPREANSCVIGEERVFDIGNAGPRHRFTVLTDQGPIIAHNCMFGQGWKGLIEYAKGYGVELSEEDSQNAVNAYREDYKPVQRMWYACGDAAISAVENPGEQFRVGEYLTFRSNRSFLMLRLPSGRVIRWFKPLVQEQQTPWGEMKPVVTAMCVDTFTRRWQRARIIGSSFYQSSVQGIAADIMREGCMRLERNRYPLRMRIHDEYLMQVRIDSKASVEGALKIISAPIPWAPGLPIAGEGWEGLRFKK